MDSRHKIFRDKIYTLPYLERYEAFYDLFDVLVSEYNVLGENIFEDVVLYVNEFDNDESEPGMLKTILICLKAFKRYDIISEIFDRILVRYENLK